MPLNQLVVNPMTQLFPSNIFMGNFSLIRINRAPMIYDHILKQNNKKTVSGDNDFFVEETKKKQNLILPTIN